MFIGVGAELCKQHVFLGPRRDFDPAFFSEGAEFGDEIALRPIAERVVEVPQPGRLVAPLGKGALTAEAPGEIAEDNGRSDTREGTSGETWGTTSATG